MPAQQPPVAGAHAAHASGEDVRRILGDLDEAKVVEILALRPSVVELEEAAVWATGDGDVLGKSGRPLSTVEAAIIDIVTADEEEEPPAVS